MAKLWHIVGMHENANVENDKCVGGQTCRQNVRCGVSSDTQGTMPKLLNGTAFNGLMSNQKPWF